MFKKGTNIRDLFAESEKPIQIILKRRASQDMPPLVSVSPKLMAQPKFSVHVSQAQIHSPERKTYYLGELKTTKRKPLPHSNSITIKNTNLSTTLTTNQYNTYVGKINYTLKFVIGWGGFGKVWKVEHKRSRQIFAMKELQKAKILGKNSVKSVLNEKNLLSKLKHPFIVNIVAAFQDRETLYLVMDYLSGGDLRFHLILNKQFKEDQISNQYYIQKNQEFFIGCLILGLEYMHTNQIIHRDLKPENLVFDQQGYLRITDLGIARLHKLDNHNETSGTPGYMAPEVLLRQNHSYGVDYFALGVMTYELITGKRPYTGRSRKEVRDEILGRQVLLSQKECPNYSASIIDFTNKLIQRKQSLRLGIGGISQLKDHPWFNGFDWVSLYSKKMAAPYQPKCEEYNRKLQQGHQESDKTLIEEFTKQLRVKEVQQQFDGYTYIHSQ
ncbi:unnamed protein product [Paramecium octaurelia]|uniref:non-specific serine/threonine protein kinase n=1 Tax=Paramecium octaurelia TaxID=43137 RepID=A0A8S1VZD3_PAROT|nr:unnamed protein product [Paramecium octaurelia]